MRVSSSICHFSSGMCYFRSINWLLTSILIAPWASSSFNLAFFCASCTLHFLKYVT